MPNTTVVDFQEGSVRYAKRVFVSLIFLADSYNRRSTLLIPGSKASTESEKNTAHKAIQMCLTAADRSGDEIKSNSLKRKMQPHGVELDTSPTILTTYI